MGYSLMGYSLMGYSRVLTVLALASVQHLRRRAGAPACEAQHLRARRRRLVSSPTEYLPPLGYSRYSHPAMGDSEHSHGRAAERSGGPATGPHLRRDLRGSPMHSRPLRRRRGRRAVAAPMSTAKTRIDRSWPPTASRAARSSLRSGGCRWCSLADAGRQRPVVLRPPAPLSDRSALRLRWDGAGSSELATEAGRPHRRRAFVAARPSARSGSPTRSGRSFGEPSTTRLPASSRPLISWRLRRTRVLLGRLKRTAAPPRSQ